jgi:hypothetical protein
VQFDSFLNNPVVGDERPFLAGSLNGQGNVQDRVQVKDGNTIVVRAYVHNNADATKMGGEANTLAKNVKFAALVPTGSGTDMNIVGFISADNASPKSINDTMSVYGANPFTLEYVKGSAQFTNKPDGKTQKTIKLSDSITTQQGASLGDILGCFEYSGYVTFTVKVHMPTTPPKTPTYACTAFDVTKGDNRTVTVSSFAVNVPNGSTLTSADLNWGDGSTVLTTNKVTGQTHQYAKDGTYNISLSNFKVDGKTVTVSGTCAKSVTFTTPIVPPTTPPVLPNTGAGNVIGLFGVVSVLGALGYRVFLSRRLSRQ